VKILVTGTDGYIGTVLAEYLVQRGHGVTGVDTGFYRSGWLYNGVALSVQTRVKDIRELTPEDVEGSDAVVHMAELSNDPLAQLLPGITHEINHDGSVHVATISKAAGVRRFVYTSSCSVYGAAEADIVDEQSPLHPQTAYAECKASVERAIGAMASDEFSPTFLRNATAYGASPRMRFDIVLNNLAALAWTTREIRMESDGTPWRPLVHVLDICQAIALILEAPRDRVHSAILNVGDTNANYQIREIASIVADSFPGCSVTVGDRGADARSYRVSFDKIHETLPDFHCRWDPAGGARELLDVFTSIDLQESEFRSRHYTRLAQIEYLLNTRQIDGSFRWAKPISSGSTVATR
jgi:nucleoside-diphosphate-sugar epimerase